MNENPEDSEQAEDPSGIVDRHQTGNVTNGSFEFGLASKPREKDVVFDDTVGDTFE